MKNDIYEIINSIETDLTEYGECTTLDPVTCHRMKKSFVTKMKKKRNMKKAAIAACCCLAASAMLLGPFRAQAKDAGRYLSYRISEALGIKKGLSPYEDVVNQTIDKNNVKITLNNVILTDTSLIVSTTEEVSDAFSEPVSFAGTIYINGQSCLSGISGGRVGLTPKISETVLEYDLPDIDTSGPLDIELKLTEVTGQLSGNWTFQFQADGSKLRAELKEQKLDNTFKLPNDQTITLEKMIKSPIGYKIQFSESLRMSDYDMELRGTDNLGNPVTFSLFSANKGKGTFQLENISTFINENAESLTLTPYAVPFPKESGRLSNDFKQTGDPFTIPLP